jgi:hypothetical protein
MSDTPSTDLLVIVLPLFTQGTRSRYTTCAG